MPEVTLHDLAKRVEALEKKLATPPAPDWRSVVGMFDDDPDMIAMLRDLAKAREVEREAARNGDEIATCFVVDGCP